MSDDSQFFFLFAAQVTAEMASDACDLYLYHVLVEGFELKPYSGLTWTLSLPNPVPGGHVDWEQSRYDREYSESSVAHLALFIAA